MLCGGVISSYVGYIMGQEALKAVTQPEVNSDNQINRQKPTGGDYKGLKIINEKEILVKIYNRIHGKENSSKVQDSSANEQVDLINYQPESNSVNAQLFPMADHDQGVTLEVSHAKFQGSSLVLNLNLRNESEQEVSFLYSFFDIRDDQGKSLSAIVDGLPGTIPANSKNFQGILKIPTVLLDDSKTISLTLTDYPEQDLELKLQKIPIAR